MNVRPLAPPLQRATSTEVTKAVGTITLGSRFPKPALDQALQRRLPDTFGEVMENMTIMGLISPSPCSTRFPGVPVRPGVLFVGLETEPDIVEEEELPDLRMPGQPFHLVDRAQRMNLALLGRARRTITLITATAKARRALDPCQRPGLLALPRSLVCLAW